MLDEPLVAPLLELEGLELMPPLVAPEEPDFSLRSWACHSERLICPSWFVSILLNSSLSLDDEAPPAAELGLEVEEDDDVPPAEDEAGEDDLLPCDTDGEDEDPALLFESPAA